MLYYTQLYTLHIGSGITHRFIASLKTSSYLNFISFLYHADHNCRNMQRTGQQVRRVADAATTLLRSPFKVTPTSTPIPLLASRSLALSGDKITSGGCVGNKVLRAAVVPTAAPSAAAGFSFWTSSGSRATTSQQQKQLLLEHEELRRRRALLGLPVGDEDDVSMLTPVHLKSPPPDPWSLEKKVCAPPADGS
jgi:hypothetical protein